MINYALIVINHSKYILQIYQNSQGSPTHWAYRCLFSQQFRTLLACHMPTIKYSHSFRHLLANLTLGTLIVLLSNLLFEVSHLFGVFDCLVVLLCFVQTVEVGTWHGEYLLCWAGLILVVFESQWIQQVGFTDILRNSITLLIALSIPIHNSRIFCVVYSLSAYSYKLYLRLL